MRKLIFYTMTVCLLFTFNMNEVKAINSNPEKAIVAPKPAEAEEVQAMIDRINEIKNMDMSTLTTVERKELRKEVRAIKQDLKAINGVYLSVGAILIIILLLILIL